MRLFLPLLLLVISLASCHDCVTGPDHSDVVDPVERWQAYDVRNYTYMIDNVCFCTEGGKRRVVVRDNKVASVFLVEGDGELRAVPLYNGRTIDNLFEIINDAKSTPTGTATATYDAKYGFPTTADLDYSPEVVDNELWWKIVSFHVD
jgi:hypothetical protein